jgi:hypothetical protein
MDQLKQRIVRVLHQAEAEILGVLAEAASKGDYEGIDLARTAASKVKQLTKELEGRLPTTESVASHWKAQSQPARTAVRKKQSGGRGKPDKAYPHFLVQNNCLLREGWSKKEGKPYTHRVPAEVFNAVVSAMQRVAESSNGAVTAEVIMQEPGLNESGAVPDYPVYTVLGFLRFESVVREVGRGRYQVPTDVKHQAASLWDRKAVTSAEK